jgi:hypothetical protein
MKSLTIGQRGGRPAHAFANILATPNVVFYSINRRAVIFDREQFWWTLLHVCVPSEKIDGFNGILLFDNVSK